MSLVSSRVADSFRKHRLYPDFLRVKQLLKRHQFVCWLAGGAVRDLILGRDCYDFDLVTDASTENLKALFPDAVLVGEQFGVLKLVLNSHEQFDLTTFREEADYVDGRRPSHVKASTSTQDAARRDFTVNALYWDDENSKLIDSVGGLFDLEKRVLKAVGKAEVRFEEDKLRLLRLARFAAQLDFEIDSETLKAALQKVAEVKLVSGERIWAEIKKLDSIAMWNRAVANPLFIKIMESALEVERPNEVKWCETKIEFQPRFHFFYFICCSLNVDEAMKKKISQRLKISREDQVIFELFMRFSNTQDDLSSSKLALEIEKRTGLAEVLSYLVEQNRMSAIKVSEAFQLLKEHPKTFVSGDDLKVMVDLRQIGTVLLEVRELQFEGVLKDRGQTLDYIKTKFATSE